MLTMKGFLGLCLLACAIMLGLGMIKKVLKLVVVGGLLLLLLAFASSGQLGTILGL